MEGAYYLIKQVLYSIEKPIDEDRTKKIAIKLFYDHNKKLFSYDKFKNIKMAKNHIRLLQIRGRNGFNWEGFILKTRYKKFRAWRQP